MNLINKEFVIVSAYTKKTNYENIIKNLEQDCKKFEVPFHKIGYESTGSWVENTMLKPKIILQDWDELSYFYKNLIWIDADARLTKYPKYFSELESEGRDFSIFQMGSFHRVTSGTIFIRLNEKMKSFVSQWENKCKTTTERKGDQHSLRQIIADGIYSTLMVNYKPLPYSYCYVFDDSLRKLSPSIPKLEGEPIVLHTQASRNRKNSETKQTLCLW